MAKQVKAGSLAEFAAAVAIAMACQGVTGIRKKIEGGKGLQGVQRILLRLDADATLRKVAKRQETLVPYPPPSADAIVTSRQPSKNPAKQKPTPQNN